MVLQDLIGKIDEFGSELERYTSAWEPVVKRINEFCGTLCSNENLQTALTHYLAGENMFILNFESVDKRFGKVDFYQNNENKYKIGLGHGNTSNTVGITDWTNMEHANIKSILIRLKDAQYHTTATEEIFISKWQRKDNTPEDFERLFYNAVTHHINEFLNKKDPGCVTKPADEAEVESE